MKIKSAALFTVLVYVAGLSCAEAQQANINLDYNPQKNTENLIPFSATLNSPDALFQVSYTIHFGHSVSQHMLVIFF